MTSVGATSTRVILSLIKTQNAWVIDFGGRNNPLFIDNDKAETIEGDWQGIRRLFEMWLPKQVSTR